MVGKSCQDSPSPSFLQRQPQHISSLVQVSPDLVSFFFLDKGGLAVCTLQKTESLNSSSEGKIRRKEIEQKKIRKTNSLGEKPKHYQPPRSCYKPTVCCDHHTPNTDFLYFISFMRCPWKGAEGSPSSRSAFGEGSGDGEAWMGPPGCRSQLCTAKGNR